MTPAPRTVDGAALDAALTETLATTPQQDRPESPVSLGVLTATVEVVYPTPPPPS
ncbi:MULTISPECIES: hypothetical protein [unclassified Nocardia]|uniref:hypothetical protein n=1 Tax=unclassified Nocardia TaxID=2637762 RepID=UPI00278C802A|nr:MULTISPECIES: hypothetical protein [unclassified Nocardia]